MRKRWRGLLLIFCTREAGQLEIAQFVDTTRGSSSGWPHGASQRMLLRDCRVWRDAFLCEELTHVGIRRSTHGASRMEEFQAQALEQVTRSCTGVLFNLSADTWLIGLCRDKAKLKSETFASFQMPRPSFVRPNSQDASETALHRDSV